MPTLLFLHGALGAASQYKSLINNLSSKYNCLALDFPMHGHNEIKSEFSIDGFAEYLIQYIEENKLSRISIFGFSMGGYVALVAASKRPELFERIMTLATKINWNQEIALKAKSMLNPEIIESKVPHFVAELKNRHHQCDWKILMNNTAELIQNLGALPLLTDEVFSNMQTPVQLGVGDKDHSVSIEETVHVYRQLINGSMYILPATKEPFEKVDEALLMAHIQHFFTTN